MPLFMDLHKADDYDVKPTVEEIKRNHIADLAVQHKYGVKFLQYWINEEPGLVFCLMEGPDKESCAAVHRDIPKMKYFLQKKQVKTTNGLFFC